MRDERGFALVAVLLVMALVGILGAEFAFTMRLEASSVRAYKEGVIATHLAEAAIEQATREIFGEGTYVSLSDDCQLTFFRQDKLEIKRLPRENVVLGPGTFSYRITDEASRININTAPPARFDRLLTELGIKKIERDTIVDSVQDWRDPNEDHRLNGAESEDYYLKLSIPYRSHNANLLSVNELLQIKGVTRDFFWGSAEGSKDDAESGKAATEGKAATSDNLPVPVGSRCSKEKPGLVDVVSVHTGSNTVNINTASHVVLATMGLSGAEILEIESTRRESPYIALPGRFGGRQLGTTTRTFRVEAEGRVGGQVRSRVRAIIQRRGEAAAPSIVVLEWLTIQ